MTPIREVYVRFNVYPDGRVGLAIVDGGCVGVPQLNDLFDLASATVDYAPAGAKTESEARFTAEQLPKRLERELGPVLLRGRRGGQRIYGKRARPRRVQHGLSEAQLVEFANACEKFRDDSDVCGAREAAAAQLGIPPNYGGAPGSEGRRTSLYGLEKKGRSLASVT